MFHVPYRMRISPEFSFEQPLSIAFLLLIIFEIFLMLVGSISNNMSLSFGFSNLGLSDVKDNSITSKKSNNNKLIFANKILPPHPIMVVNNSFCSYLAYSVI